MSADIKSLLPHRAPMIMVDELVETAPDGARAVKTFREDDYGVENGRVIQSFLVEALAQTVAAMHGEAAAKRGRPPGVGMLTGVTDFRFGREVTAGEEITLEVTVTRRLAPFVFADGRALCGAEVVAEGEMKFYIEEAAGETNV
jgi:3-hydroxymyristoyl/3-hydroxydecanoyl-(acyl carrier protein) dehydratase